MNCTEFQYNGSVMVSINGMPANAYTSKKNAEDARRQGEIVNPNDTLIVKKYNNHFVVEVTNKNKEVIGYL